MASLGRIPPFLLLLLCVVISFIFRSSFAMSYLQYYCPDTNTTFPSDIKSLLSNLSKSTQATSALGFGTLNSTTGYVLYLCRGDVDPATCRECVDDATTVLAQNCLHRSIAAALYDECIVRYSNESFFGKLDVDLLYSSWNKNNITAITDNVTEYNEVVNATLYKVKEKAVGDKIKRFAKVESQFSNSTKALYMVAQCTLDLSIGDCSKCLQGCVDWANLMTAPGGRAVFYSCNLRYEMYPFYTQAVASAPPEVNSSSGNLSHEHTTPKRKKHIIAIIASSGTALITLFLSLALWFFVSRWKVKASFTADLDDIIDVDYLQMDFNTIRGATHSFATSRKLGQGGFGAVYKGTLENGQDIAVKRLSDNSGQGVVEFKTEVLLVAKLQHRNLVKLLGFCVSGKEKLLIYEFLPKSSLDKILFDPTQRMALNWETRFKIVCGIAKGLMYLHEDSRLKVIHRDLKSSNILLDEAMNPKISDFGLAKLFSVDQTQAVTRSIAGTYGYMAPEYILMGHYSVKSDVYSFGIIVLEIVSGQRNKYIDRPLLEEALLYRAWRFWHESEALKLVDETLGDTYSREDVMKCIHIGLLCIQENVAKRPNMTSIVAALGGQLITLPMPSPPNFFNNTHPTSSTNTSTVGSSSSGAAVNSRDISEITDLHGR